MPKNLAVIDVIPKNKSVDDVIPRNMAIDPQSMTRSYNVTHTAGVIMLTVPFMLYSSSGTETQWGDSGGVI